MPRFLSLDTARVMKTPAGMPFHNIYAVREEENIYVNLEAVNDLTSKMTTLRDMYVIVDISGSMQDYYKEAGFFRKQPSQIHIMLTRIVNSIAAFDDDGVDILFFSTGLVYQATVSNEREVAAALHQAMQAPGAFHSTMPVEAFQWITNQIRAKKRPGTVFFMTDGEMDDGGRSLEHFYATTLHNEFKTRDMFYCYSIEYGHDARGALDVLDGKFAPEQGPEDLFDKEFADNIENITAVLTQVGGMSAVGSDDAVSISVSPGAKIEMVNADLLPSPATEVSYGMNQIISIRTTTSHDQPFTLSIGVGGYSPMSLQVTPRGDEVDVKVV